MDSIQAEIARYLSLLDRLDRDSRDSRADRECGDRIGIYKIPAQRLRESSDAMGFSQSP